MKLKLTRVLTPLAALAIAFGAQAALPAARAFFCPFESVSFSTYINSGLFRF